MAHPLPPADLPSRPLPLYRVAEPLYRMYSLAYSPLYFGRRHQYRFDAPDDSFGVLYCGLDIHCAFIETFGHATGTSIVRHDELRRRGIARIDHAVAFRLVDLTGAGLARIGADNDLCAGEYQTAQQWSLAFYRHPEHPDGILYRARHDPSRLAVALYSHTEELITVTTLGSLADRAHATLLGNILDTYRFGLA